MSKASSPRDPSPGQREPLFGVDAPGWAFTNVGLLSLVEESVDKSDQQGLEASVFPRDTSPVSSLVLGRPRKAFFILSLSQSQTKVGAPALVVHISRE